MTGLHFRPLLLTTCLLCATRAFAEVPPLPLDEPRWIRLDGLDEEDETLVQTGYRPNAPWIVKDTLSNRPSIATGENGRMTPAATFGTIYQPGNDLPARDPEQRQWNPVIRVQHFFNNGHGRWQPFIGAGGMYYWQSAGRNPQSDIAAAAGSADARQAAGGQGSLWATVLETGVRYKISRNAALVFSGQFAPYAASAVLHMEAADGAQFGESTALMSWDGAIVLTSLSYQLGS